MNTKERSHSLFELPGLSSGAASLSRHKRENSAHASACDSRRGEEISDSLLKMRGSIFIFRNEVSSFQETLVFPRVEILPPLPGK